MAKSDIRLSSTQCLNVVKVQISQLSGVVNPKTIKDDDKLKDVGIEDKQQLKTLKQRITKVVVVKEHMDSDAFFNALDFDTDSTVLAAGDSTFDAQDMAFIKEQ
jgi:hypothetical protein